MKAILVDLLIITSSRTWTTAVQTAAACMSASADDWWPVVSHSTWVDDLVVVWLTSLNPPLLGYYYRVRRLRAGLSQGRGFKCCHCSSWANPITNFNPYIDLWEITITNFQWGPPTRGHTIPLSWRKEIHPFDVRWNKYALRWGSCSFKQYFHY